MALLFSEYPTKQKLHQIFPLRKKSHTPCITIYSQPQENHSPFSPNTHSQFPPHLACQESEQKQWQGPVPNSPGYLPEQVLLYFPEPFLSEQLNLYSQNSLNHGFLELLQGFREKQYGSKLWSYVEWILMEMPPRASFSYSSVTSFRSDQPSLKEQNTNLLPLGFLRLASHQVSNRQLHFYAVERAPLGNVCLSWEWYVLLWQHIIIKTRTHDLITNQVQEACNFLSLFSLMPKLNLL